VVEPRPGRKPWPSRRAAYYALAVIILATMLNFFDAQVFGMMAQRIKIDLHLSDEQLGFLIGPANIIFYVLVGIPMARLVDIYPRKIVLACGVAAIGGITAKEVTVPEILPNLKNGSIQVITVPPLAAEQLQWASMVTHINTMTTGFGIGAIIVSSARMSGLPQNLKDVLVNRGHEAADRLTKSIRNLDAQSFARLKTSKSAYEPTDAEKQEWRDVFTKVRAQLRGAVFTPAVFDKVVSLAQ